MTENVKVEVFAEALKQLVEEGVGEIMRETPVPVECPECGTSFEVNASTAECPNCGLPVRVEVG